VLANLSRSQSKRLWTVSEVSLWERTGVGDHTGNFVPEFSQHKRVLTLVFFRLVSMIQFDLTDLRGSWVASTYSVEDGPKPVI